MQPITIWQRNEFWLQARSHALPVESSSSLRHEQACTCTPSVDALHYPKLQHLAMHAIYLGMPDKSQSSPEAAPTCAGATGGIGKAIALAFATQGQLDICLWSRSRDKLEAVARQVEQLGSRPHIVTGDLTKGEDCRRGVAEAVSLAMSCQLCWPAACQQGAGLGHVTFQRACSCRQSCSLGVSGCDEQGLDAEPASCAAVLQPA